MIILFDKSPTICASFRNHLKLLNIELTKRKLKPLNCAVVSGSLQHFLKTELYNYKSSCPEWTLCTPGNSLGFMNGGLDKNVIETFKLTPIELQNYILKINNGYSPPGKITLLNLHNILGQAYKSSEIWLSTGISTIAHCSTMVVPEPISNERLIFDLIWNLLESLPLNSNILIPGLGTGYGSIDVDIATKTIIAAILIFHLETDLLTKSLLVINFMKKDYKLFEVEKDLEILESKLNFPNKDVIEQQSWASLLDSVKI